MSQPAFSKPTFEQALDDGLEIRMRKHEGKYCFSIYDIARDARVGNTMADTYQELIFEQIPAVLAMRSVLQAHAKESPTYGDWINLP